MFENAIAYISNLTENQNINNVGINECGESISRSQNYIKNNAVKMKKKLSEPNLFNVIDQLNNSLQEASLLDLNENLNLSLTLLDQDKTITGSPSQTQNALDLSFTNENETHFLNSSPIKTKESDDPFGLADEEKAHLKDLSQQTDKTGLEETNGKDKSPIQDAESKLKKNAVSVSPETSEKINQLTFSQTLQAVFNNEPKEIASKKHDESFEINVTIESQIQNTPAIDLFFNKENENHFVFLSPIKNALPKIHESDSFDNKMELNENLADNLVAKTKDLVKSESSSLQNVENLQPSTSSKGIKRKSNSESTEHKYPLRERSKKRFLQQPTNKTGLEETKSRREKSPMQDAENKDASSKKELKRKTVSESSENPKCKYKLRERSSQNYLPEPIYAKEKKTVLYKKINK